MTFIDDYRKKYKRTTVDAPCPIDFLYKEPAGDAPLVLMFHGYQQTGEKILQLLEGVLEKEWGYLCLNGPYPLPYKKRGDDEWRMAFSWYFYDTSGQQYFIDQKFPSAVIKALVEQLGHKNTEKHVMGFSQGGYLSPFASLELDNVKSNIAINAEYKAPLLPDTLPFPIFNVNGEDDLVVDAENCRKSFDILLSKGNKGGFFLLKDTNHDINEAIVNKIREIHRSL